MMSNIFPSVIPSLKNTVGSKWEQVSDLNLIGNRSPVLPPRDILPWLEGDKRGLCTPNGEVHHLIRENCSIEGDFALAQHCT